MDLVGQVLGHSFSWPWDDASVDLKIPSLMRDVKGWGLLPHLSGLFLHPRGTMEQLEAPLCTLYPYYNSVHS